ncbi:acetyl-CoA carboxylase carboxyl transferase subunit beta [Lactobacillus pentosus]|jgi:acetyl-CoA carboxylase carboxyl transferase subunit beta|uniref:Acetyl-coenzyme A carboxylase carboxyl transferase subunit beta n=1 Tax=Lactiplantibacillus pentosus TaxID=1589 RepID=A0AB37RIS9_LACPE|nr:acetyl-CoA carboxylase carboxyltransferase subunit beta [Lactiplantibacillus pentosus]MCH4129736.1 acetyl-CoA carboxylase carboxyl transferase subunit beta [Lactiplantibacillus sp.]BBM20160.1 acetyl-coenzyme A carboxylase carboxyl transferase subunit beta 2 [Lactiplantibacillus plantarum]MCT3292889.1 acetyl-CoA carboxylase carboxyl transferase subunit beta [Lactiplantibacillus pentosus]MPQ18190.1 acetyl-CoA carboxylase carboxyl transferase subunit beta [Lactiplantibacillus pentosus]RMW41532
MPKRKFQAPTEQQLAVRRDYIPDALLTRCPVCHQDCYTQDLGEFKVCPHCDYGFRLPAWERVAQLTDVFDEHDADLRAPADFTDAAYQDKLRRAAAQSQMNESVLTGIAATDDMQFGLGVMDTNFMMGSLGSATGEKITRLFDTCTIQKLPVVMVTASGGARMQEGTRALMQMAKISAAVAKHREAGLLYITILTDPTTGGVTASFAMQGDIMLSEPRALIGFAGRRVIEQTIQQTPPADFQRAETLFANGWLDQIVPRPALKQTLQRLLRLTQGGRQNG